MSGGKDDEGMVWFLIFVHVRVGVCGQAVGSTRSTPLGEPTMNANQYGDNPFDSAFAAPK